MDRCYLGCLESPQSLFEFCDAVYALRCIVVLIIQQLLDRIYEATSQRLKALDICHSASRVRTLPQHCFNRLGSCLHAVNHIAEVFWISI